MHLPLACSCVRTLSPFLHLLPVIDTCTQIHKSICTYKQVPLQLCAAIRICNHAYHLTCSRELPRFSHPLKRRGTHSRARNSGKQV